jgi:type IV pilus biogenesis protein CpaD/CtpE
MRVSLRIAVSALALMALTGCADHAPLAAGPCPAFPDFPADLHTNDGSPYLGCTNAANLAAMVAEKHDLEKGRPLGPANGARESKAIEDYEAGKTKTSEGSSSTAGAGLLLQPTNSQGTQATQ